MPRRLLQKMMPDAKTIRQHKHLKIFGTLLHHPNLWHLNRHSVAKGFAIGLFCAWIPVPFQMVLAAGGAILFHSNLPLSIALVWLTNPLTMPPMFYGAYKLGVWVIGTPIQDFQFELSITWLSNGLALIWQPFLLGCAILAVLNAVMAYVVIQLLWRWMVIRKWRRRHRSQ